MAVVGECYQAKFDFASASSGVLSFKVGDRFLLVNKTNEDWWMVRSPSQELGLVPANYLEPEEENGADPGTVDTPPCAGTPATAAAMYVALYNWVKADSTQLSFKKGDKLLLVDKTDQQWWTMRSTQGEESGLVPINYIDKFEEEEEGKQDVSEGEGRGGDTRGKETAKVVKVNGEAEGKEAENPETALREVLRSIENAIQQIHDSATNQGGKYTPQQLSNLQNLVAHRQKVLADSRTNGTTTTNNLTPLTKLTHPSSSTPASREKEKSPPPKSSTTSPPRRHPPPPPADGQTPVSSTASLNSSWDTNTSALNRRSMEIEHSQAQRRHTHTYESQSLPRRTHVPVRAAPSAPPHSAKTETPPSSRGDPIVQVHPVRVTATSAVQKPHNVPGPSSTFSPAGSLAHPAPTFDSAAYARRRSADLPRVPVLSVPVSSGRRGSSSSPGSPRKTYPLQASPEITSGSFHHHQQQGPAGHTPQSPPQSGPAQGPAGHAPQNPPQSGPAHHGGGLRRNPSSSPNVSQKFNSGGSPTALRRHMSSSSASLPDSPRQQRSQGSPSFRSDSEGSPPRARRLELPSQFPSSDGAELVEVVRSRTGMSHKKSLLAVAGMLEFIKSKVPLCASMVDGLLVAVSQSQAEASASSSRLQGSGDLERLREIFFDIQELKDDQQQRGWAVHDDQQAIVELLEELLQILCDADPEVTKTVIQEDKYENILNVIAYYQIESRLSIRLLLLKVFGVLCGLDHTVISVLLSSVLPNELGRDMKDNLKEIQKTLYSSTVCTMIFSTADDIPLSVYDQWTVDYVLFLMDTVEAPPEEDEEEQVADAFLNVILSYNQHFKDPAGNLVMRALEQRPNPRNFSEKLMFLVNRGEDPVAIAEPCCPDSLTKFLLDVFSERSTSGMFYTTDMMVLIDIISRQLHDLEAGEEMRTHQLKLLYRLVSTTEYGEHKHRRKDLTSCLNRIAQEEGEESERDHEVIRKIWINFPGLFEEEVTAV